MTAEENNFQSQLAQAPNDAATRLLLAEHFAERGDWRHRGYRWLAERSVMPQDYRATATWDWNDGLHFDNLDGAIPHELFVNLDGGRLSISESYREYPSRVDAEEAFCRVHVSAADDGTFI